MGQKVHPRIFRIGSTQSWKSRWFSKKNFSEFLESDITMRKHILTKLVEGGVADVVIERSGTMVSITIHTSKPGVVIGRGGVGVEELRKELMKKFLTKKQTLKLSIEEVPHPYLVAQIVCRNMIEQIEKRLPFRRVLKSAVDQVQKAGAKGVRVSVAGRLGGAEIARKEKLSWGSLPLHTIRADIDYARGAAHTTYGMIGVKVWIYRGEVFREKSRQTEPAVV